MPRKNNAGTLTAAQVKNLQGIIADRAVATGKTSDGFQVGGKTYRSMSDLLAGDPAGFVAIGSDPSKLTPVLAGKPLSGKSADQSRGSYMAHWTREARKLTA